MKRFAFILICLGISALVAIWFQRPAVLSEPAREIHDVEVCVQLNNGTTLIKAGKYELTVDGHFTVPSGTKAGIQVETAGNMWLVLPDRKLPLTRGGQLLWE